MGLEMDALGTLDQAEADSMRYRTPHARPLATNGFAVDLPETIEVIVRDLPHPNDVQAERERLDGYWFVHWLGGKLYHLRLKAGGPNVDGTLRPMRVADHPWLLRSRLEDAIGSALPRYEPVRERPFTFLAQRAELIKSAAASARIDHPLLHHFKVTPKFALNAKIYELADGRPAVGLFVTVGMRFDIDATISELALAGVDVTGMYVVRRQPIPGERRLVGRIGSLDRQTVTLSETTGPTTISEWEIKLEGSKENFSRCLTALLGPRYRTLMDALDDEEAGYRLGPGFDQTIEQMGTFLRKAPIVLAQGVSAQVGQRILLQNETGAARSVYAAPRVDYVFDRTGSKSAEYAWVGLSHFGPYDRSTFATKSPRILVAFPASTRGKVEAFLRAFRDGMGAGHSGFAKGFRDLFGLISVEFVMCPVELSISNRAGAEAAYRAAIEARLSAGEEVHAGIIVLFDEHAFLPGLQNPYIRTKAMLLTLGIATQEVRMWTINQRPASLQYTLQNFSISLYAKLNGTPWTVNHDKVISDELVVGMGFAELSGSRFEDRQRYVGITTVFSGDGTYVLGNVSKECSYESRADMVRVSMLSILKELKTRNNWRPGDTVRVIFHAHRPLRRVDLGKIAFACTREIGTEQDIQMAFVTVSHEHPFFILDRQEKGLPVRRDGDEMKGVFAPARGTIARVGRSTRLLAVNSGKLIKRANSPLPKPLLISLHPDSTFKDVDYLAEQVLKFTSLSWRSTLPAGTPVTIFYSERIAELLGRLREVPDWSATALSVRLKWSRWFL